MEKFKQFQLDLKFFSGYLSAKPEIKYMESGKVKCTFAIPLKDKQNKDNTIWLNCECWSPVLAETIAEKYDKGTFISVAGYFKENEYNEKKYVNLVVLFAN